MEPFVGVVTVSRRWQFTFPLKYAVGPNERRRLAWNRRALVGQAKRVQANVRVRAISQERQQGQPKPDPVPEQVRVHVDLYGHNMRDPDNLMGSVKWILDGLKGRYLVDDSPDHLTLTVGQQIDRKRKRVVVTITEVGR